MAWGSLTVAGGIALVIALAIYAAIPSRFVRSRLRFSVWLLIALLGLEVVIQQRTADSNVLAAVARLTFGLALINIFISLLVNPWREHRASERFPAILQDVAIITIFAIVAVLMNEELLTTSAVGAVVVGFALQDTLGNLFSGLAIQIEKPYRVGHWIAVGDREGQVQEITWRATKLRTKAGQFLIVPNGNMAKEAILNYSEPILPTRLEIEIGASYLTPPTEVKHALHEALANAPLVLATPPPSIRVRDFGASAVTYLVQFWIGDYALDEEAYDQVRTNIWYTMRRHNIEIPYPIQIEYSREEQPVRSEGDVHSAAAALDRIDLFSPLTRESRFDLARAAKDHIFCAGEAIVRQGEAGSSMYLVISGRARVLLEPSGQEVAVIAPGGIFGEMSMLTGEPRTATVRAVDDVRVLEITADRFREIALERPGLVEHISSVVAVRRAGLDEARAAATASGAVAAAPRTLLGRIQQFLRLPQARA